MTAQRGPGPRRRSAAILVALPVLATINLLAVSEDSLRIAVSGVLHLVAAGAATAWLSVAARRLRQVGDPEAAGWTLIAVSSAFVLAGIGVLLVADVTAGRSAVGGLPYGFILLSYPPLAAGVLRLPHEPMSRREWWSNALDLAVFAVAALMVVWQFDVRLWLSATHSGFTREVLPRLCFSALDTLLVLLLFYRLAIDLGRGVRFGPMLLLVLHSFGLVAADLLLAGTNQATPSGASLVDLSYVVASTCLALAGLMRLMEQEGRLCVECVALLRNAATVGLSYVWMAVALFMLGWALFHPAEVNGGFVLSGVFGAMVLSLVRQVHVGRQNAELCHRLTEARAALEQTVAERTAQLGHSEEALRASENYRRFTFESLRVPVVLMDRNTLVFTDCNAAAVEVFGCSGRDELLGKRPIDFSPETQYDGRPSAEHIAEHRELLRAVGEVIVDWRYKGPGGAIRDGEVRVMAVPGDNSNELQFSIQDITERRRTIEALRLSEERFAAAFRCSPDVVVLSRLHDGLLIDVNESFEQVYACRRADAVGRLAIELGMYSEPGERDRLVSRLRAEGALRDVPIAARRITGERFSALLSASPIQVGDAELMLSIIRDMSERERAAAQLERERGFTNAILDSVPGLLYLYDDSDHLLRWNRRHESLLGYTDEEMAGKYVLDSFDDAHRAQVAEAVARIRHEGSAEVEVPVRTKHRGLVPFLLTGQALDVGGVQYFTGVGIDITERHAAEQALRESQQELDRILRTLPDIVYRLDVEGRITFINDAVREYGYDPAQMVGHHILEYVADADRERATRRLDERRTGDRRTRGFELRLLPADGQGRTFEVRSAAVTDEPVFLLEAVGVYSGDWPSTETYLGTQGIARDITERKRALEALSESEEKFRKLFEQAADAVVLMDRGVFIDCNERALQLFHCERDMLLGTGPEDWSPEAQADGEMTSERGVRVLGQARAAGHSHFDWRFQRRDGSLIDAEVAITSVNLEGRLVWHALLRDVTEARMAASERSELQAQLAQAQKMESVGRLAGGVAHDFNNMLNVIYGHTELALLSAEAGSRLRADLQQILAAAKRSADLTRQLLAFARQEVVSPQVLNLNAAIDSMLKLLRRLIGEDINLEWRPAAGLWSVRIDPTQVDQILANPAVNARDAIVGNGSIVIETSNQVVSEADRGTHAGLPSGSYILLSFTDDGCGMDEATVQRIFEPFFTTKAVGQGTGLGLATVYGIVQQNAGDISVYSEPGRGTTFRIYLPALVAEATGPKEPAKVTERGGHGELILLVEDEWPILQIGRRMLTNIGYEVLAANSPSEALQLAAEHGPAIQLLITDVIMPEMNGRDLATQLLSTIPQLKVLYMTGYPAEVISRHGILGQGTPLLDKPFTRQKLAAKVRELLAAE